MPYGAYAFDGLELSNLDGAVNMGTGQALSSFTQVPGGGFYDNYGSNRSPQGIRPITLSGKIYEEVAADRVAALDAMRAKIGVRGKLTLLFDDDSLRWQWARLVEVDTPRDKDNIGDFPFNLTFVTASQIWYGVVVTEPQWNWGDLSWTFGDGTVEMGEAGTEETLTATGATGTPPTGGTTQDIVLANDGNRDVVNMIITITAGAADSFTAVKVQNLTNGYSFYSTEVVPLGFALRVDTGAMSVTEGNNDRYATFVPGDVRNWLPLAPGNNTIRIYVTGNTSQTGSIAFEYYHHYA